MINQLTNRIMIWNCPGVAGRAFHRVCERFVKDNNPGIVVILETHMDPLKLYRTFSQLGSDSMVGSEVRGFE